MSNIRYDFKYEMGLGHHSGAFLIDLTRNSRIFGSGTRKQDGWSRDVIGGYVGLVTWRVVTQKPSLTSIRVLTHLT